MKPVSASLLREVEGMGCIKKKKAESVLKFISKYLLVYINRGEGKQKTVMAPS